MDYNTYVKQLLEPYNNTPIDLSIGFYGLCSYQHIAWDYVFEQIRNECHSISKQIILLQLYSTCLHRAKFKNTSQIH